MVRCFGEFHLGHTGCDTCPVIKSCKRESLIRIKNDKQRQKIQANKQNTLEGLQKEKALQIIYSFFTAYKKPISTYRITKDFRKYKNINVSDTKILSLCNELHQRKKIHKIKKGKARYWILFKN